MIQPIPQIGHPVLRTRCEEVDLERIGDGSIQSLIDDMVDTMRDANGAGIAANQVGVSLRICVIGVDSNPRYPYKPPIPLTVLVNPVCHPEGEATYRNNEGCLSVPIRGDLLRYSGVTVSAYDRDGEPFAQTYRGLSAGTVQHEVDHLDGRLIVDRFVSNETISTWDMFREYGMAEYLRRIEPVIAMTEPRVGDVS